MFKAYDISITPPDNGTLIEAKVAFIKHTKDGMKGNTYYGAITNGNKGIITVTIPDLLISISVTTNIILSVLSGKDDIN